MFFHNLRLEDQTHQAIVWLFAYMTLHQSLSCWSSRIFFWRRFCFCRLIKKGTEWGQGMGLFIICVGLIFFIATYMIGSWVRVQARRSHTSWSCSGLSLKNQRITYQRDCESDRSVGCFFFEMWTSKQREARLGFD